MEGQLYQTKNRELCALLRFPRLLQHFVMLEVLNNVDLSCKHYITCTVSW